MNNYLITGGLGFIGSHLALELLQNNNNRVWIIDDGTNAAWNPRKGRIDYKLHVRDLLVQLMGGYESDTDDRNPRLVCISGDCAHRNVLDRISAGHFRTVFHMAADNSVAKSIEEPLVVLERNVAKTLQVAQACAEGNTRLVFSSSAAVYGHFDETHPIDENRVVNPTNPYGLSKITCENWFKVYGSLYGLDFVNLRYFNVFGERQRGGSPYAGVIGNWIQALHFKKPLIVYGDGDQTRDFIHVSDVVQANIKAIDVPTTAFTTYNICSGKQISLNELANIIKTETKEKFHMKYEDARKGEVRNCTGANARALIGLGWKPEKPILEGISQTLRWRGIK